MKPVTQTLGPISILHDAQALPDCPPQFFDKTYWEEAGGLLGIAEEGKGSTLFVQNQGQQWAIRHYCRGGGMAWFIRDAYWWFGLKRSRPWCEWQLLAEMTEKGLPVPKPVAARVVRHGFVYRADLIMERIQDAKIWQQCMLNDELDAGDWQALGKMIRRFHDIGVFHHDLNIRNIMRKASGEPYLIDFDRGRMRSGTVWKRQNLNRLHRSIIKLQDQGIDLHFSEPCWRQLLQGYMLA
ncbi:MAG: 3-deoxy-D-manno-octulosonic acid kinase, partial [Nevskiales bacterium]